MHCYLINAKRTAIAPSGGLHKDVAASQLVSPLLSELGALYGEPAQVILGNAIGGGGNIARYAALEAGLDVPAMSLDSQCCSGLDSIILASALIAAGQGELIFAGGVESYSQRPQRAAKQADGSYLTYLRPAFAPQNDVDMSQAAAALAKKLDISKAAQHQFAQASHRKALAAQQLDPAARRLSEKLLARLPIVAGCQNFGLTSASIALEADGGSVVALASEAFVNHHQLQPLARIVASEKASGDASQPALVPIAACQALLAKQSLAVTDIDHWQIMEAYAVQAMATISALGIHPQCVNTNGGALARGHAIGASGTVLVVEALKAMQAGELGICTIAAGGGLASALLIEKLNS